MNKLIKCTNFKKTNFPAGAQKIIDQGFVDYDGAVLFQAMKSSRSHVSLTDFPDVTGLECFVNSFHMEDLSEDQHLECAFIFVERCFLEWNKHENNGGLRAIISHSGKETVLKVHKIREGESWLDDELELYDNAIFVAESVNYDCVTKIIQGKLDYAS